MTAAIAEWVWLWVMDVVWACAALISTHISPLLDHPPQHVREAPCRPSRQLAAITATLDSYKATSITDTEVKRLFATSEFRQWFLFNRKEKLNAQQRHELMVSVSLRVVVGITAIAIIMLIPFSIGPNAMPLQQRISSFSSVVDGSIVLSVVLYVVEVVFVVMLVCASGEGARTGVVVCYCVMLVASGSVEAGAGFVGLTALTAFTVLYVPDLCW